MKKISFYTYSTFFSGGYKSSRFSTILLNAKLKNNIVKLVGLPERFDSNFDCVKHKIFLFHKFLNKIPSLFYFGNKRFVLEKCFDIFCAVNLLFDNSEIVFTSIRLNFTTSVAKKLGKLVVFEASEMHPLTTYKLLSKEYNRINISEFNIYNDKKAINAFLTCIENADLIICFTQYSLNSFLENSVSPSKLVLINPGFDSLSDYQIKSVQRNNFISFVCTANHTLLKGTHKLLHAWSNLNIDAELIIIGEVSLMVKQYIIQNELVLNNVKFLGALNKNQIDDVYLNNNVVGVLLSFCEGGPRAVLEYLAYGFPVIATESCSFDYVIDGVNGSLLREDCSIQDVEYSLNLFMDKNVTYSKFVTYNNSNNLHKSYRYSEKVIENLDEL